MRFSSLGVMSVFGVVALSCTFLPRSDRTLIAVDHGHGASVALYRTSGSPALDVKIRESRSWQSLSLPFDQVGGSDFVKTRDRLLLTGHSSQNGKGYLVVWLLSGATYQSFGSYAESGSDFVDVVWSETKGRLYLLDGAKKRLISAPFTEASTAVPKMWTVELDVAQHPELNTAADAHMSLVDDGAEPMLTFANSSDLLAPIIMVHLKASGPVVSSVPAQAASPTIDDDRILVGMQVLNVSGLAGDTVKIQKVFPVQELLGQVTMDANGAGLAQLVSPLALGDVLVLESGVFGRKTGLVYGVKETQGAGETIPGWGVIEAFPDSLSTGAYVHAPFFAVPLSVGVSLGGPGTLTHYAPTTAPTTLVVGSRSDIMELGNGQKALLGPGIQSFPSEVGFLAAGENGMDAVDLAIVDDPALAFTEVAFQWWVTGPDSQVYLSEILLVQILPDLVVPPDVHPTFFEGMGNGGLVVASSGASAASSLQASRFRTRPDAATRHRALKSWLRKSGGVAPDVELRRQILKKHSR